MKKTFSKSMAWVLSVVIMIGMFVIAPMTANAMTESQFNEKIATLKSKYPHMSVWGDNTYYENGVAKAWQCHGYAWQIAYEMFGSSQYTPNSGWTQSYSMGTICAGDVVRIQGDTHTIFVTKVTSDTVYYTDNVDFTGYSQTYTGYHVRWDQTYSLSSLSGTFTYKWHFNGGDPIPTDTTAPTISNLRTENVRGSSFTIKCDLSDNVGVTRVWLVIYGPNGEKQFGVSASNGNFSYTINTSEYGGEGNYAFHIYAFDAAENSAKAVVENIIAVSDTIAPTISDVKTVNVSGKSFTIQCQLSDNVGVTRVWLNIYGPGGSNGYGLEASNGLFSHTINTADYGGAGDYSVHIYAFDLAGNETPSGISFQAYSDTEKPVISNAKAVNCSEESFTVQCDLYDNIGVTRVWLNIYGPSGSDGYGLEASSGFFSHTINTFDYGGAGDFTVHIYAFDAEGNETPCAINGIKAYVDYSISPKKTADFNGHTYEYYDYPLKWFDAYRFCEKKGGHLATITSAEEDNFISGLVEDYSVWVGGRTFDNSPWMWITGEAFAYMNWGWNQPDNYNASEDALQYVYDQGTIYWNDAPRDTTLTFICEYDNTIDVSKYTPAYKLNYNGHEYWYFENRVDWQTAKKICEEKGGYLAIPNDINENDMILSGLKCTSNTLAWIGISDIENEGVWKDVKGNVIQYTNWSYPQPDNYGGREDYGHMYEDGTWNDANCGCNCCNNVGFVCEFDDLCTGSGHDYKLTSQTPATCTTDGKKVYKCSKCGDTKTETIKATGHSYTEKVVAPTCTEKGYTLHTCTECGDSYKDTYTPAKGHKYTETVVEPTATAQGYTLHTCSECGHSYKDNYTAKLITNNSTLSASSIVKGQSVTMTAKAVGGTSPYKYAYLYKTSNGKWSVLRNYSTASSYTFKPTAAGKYTLMVRVKDSKGTIVSKSFALNVNDPLKNTSKVSSTSITKGQSVKLTGAASGGTAPYKYAYLYKTSNGKWSVLRNYSTASSYTFKPTAAGKYTLMVKVKDSKNAVVSKSFTLNVTKPLANTSKVSSASITKGQSVKLTGAASGGTAPYKYAYLYKTSNGKWSVLRNYSTASSYTFKPTAAGKYTLMVRVKDSKGTIVSKSFVLNVIQPLSNTSKVSSASITKGQSVKLTGAASGGTSPYKYAYFAKAPNGNWYTLKDYSTAASFNFKPKAVGKYTLTIKVKDSKNAVVSKSFTLTVRA